jgi:hypothetical protein
MSREGKVQKFGKALLAAVSMVVAMVVAADNHRPPLTEQQVVEQYGARAERVLKPRFQFAGVEWPPRRVTLLALKETRRLELWVQERGRWHHVREYRIKGMSGELGPKLREGDRQVPEGIYRIEKLNPNSGFHLSMKLNYPNEFDLEQAQLEGRKNPGSAIFIHGSNVSSGCLAMGDRAIEELFVLTSLIGKENVAVIISPHDFRTHPVPQPLPGNPVWRHALNQTIADRMKQFPLERK